MRESMKLVIVATAGTLLGILGTGLACEMRSANSKAVTVTKAVPNVEETVPRDRAPVGTAILYGKISAISTERSPGTVTFKLVDWVLGSDNREQAALEDEKCTLERVEQDTCWPADFYVRDTPKVMTLPVIKEPIIMVMARDGDKGFRTDKKGNIYQERVSLEELDTILRANDFTYIPFIITTSDGAAISLEEQYIP